MQWLLCDDSLKPEVWTSLKSVKSLGVLEVGKGYTILAYVFIGNSFSMFSFSNKMLYNRPAVFILCTFIYE